MSGHRRGPEGLGAPFARGLQVADAGLLAMVGPLTAATQVSSDSTKKDSVPLAVFADGSIRGVATSGTKESTVGTGSLGVSVQTNSKEHWAALIAVASTT